MHQRDDINSLLLSVVNAIGCAGSLALFYVITDGSLSTSQANINFVLFSYFMTRFNLSLDKLPPNISTFNTVVADSQRLIGFLHKRPQITDSSAAIDFSFTEQVTIEFVNISFAIESKLVLNNLSFCLMPYQKLAIVGPTGCGKSTIINLLLRFYEPTHGQILINGVNITCFTIRSIRCLFSVVAQEFVLFDDSVLKNIKYGCLSAIDRDCVEAAKYAELISSILIATRGS